MLQFMSNNSRIKLQAFKISQNFKSFLLYSTASSSSPSTKETNPNFVNYLVETLGFSHQQSVSTSTRLLTGGNKKVRDFNFAGNADSVIDLFNQHGFSQSHIRKIVSFLPRILATNVDKTLKPKLKLLKDLGFFGSDLVHLISKCPRLLRYRLNHRIQVLRKALGTDDNVVRYLKQPDLFAASSSLKHLIPNIALLENEYGIPIDTTKKAIHRNSRPFLLKTDLFRDILVRVEQNYGIPRDSAMFFYGVSLLACYGEKNLESKCQIFKSFGWTQSHVASFIRHNPCCLTSSEARIRNSLDVLMNKLDYQPAYLASHPPLIGYSLEKRILPRHKILQLLKEKGLIRKDYTLYSVICLPESRFLERFVLPFEEVHEFYTKQTGSTLRMPAE